MSHNPPALGTVRPNSVQALGSNFGVDGISKSSLRYFKTKSEIIRLAVIMYIRFSHSLRSVEALLHDRGIDICHEVAIGFMSGAP